MKSTKSILLALAIGTASMAANAAVLVVDPVTGKLKGATDVDLGYARYDVSFVDGSCVDVFNGCTPSTSFTFKDENAALGASAELLDQVLINSALGMFDGDTALTFGCSATDYCWVMTPYKASSTDVFTTAASNRSAAMENNGLYDDLRVGDMYLSTANTANASHQVWAVWTLAKDDTNVMPEPGTLALMALAPLALAFRRRY